MPRVLLTATNPLPLSSLNGTNGFRLDGSDAFDRFGLSVSNAGDVNGDGFDDVIAQAVVPGAGSDNNARYVTYVVFGKATGYTSTFDLSSLDGTNGFRLDGPDTYSYSGSEVSSAGDFNGDGFDDLIIGAHSSHVVFGRSSGFGASLDLSSLNGSNGFRLRVIDVFDALGSSVSGAGDVNGDGFDDLIIGAPGGDVQTGDGAEGESYVVFGRSGVFASSLDLSSLNGHNGFRIDGIDSVDFAGSSVSGGGDVNGDGLDDLIVGALNGDAGGRDSGESYVVFGKSSGFASTLNLSSLNGSNGFRIDGIATGDQSGRSVSIAGDVNGDGFDDVIIGASGSDAGGRDSGESYVVFGRSSGFGASLSLSSLNGRNGFRLKGINAYDESGHSVSSAGDVNGDGFDDLIIGAPSGDASIDNNGQSYFFYDSGQSYLVFGRSSGFPSAIDLASLDGIIGFKLDGVDSVDGAGGSVSGAGDMNGDGFDDLIIAADGGSPGASNLSRGEYYVVFGGNFTDAANTQLGGAAANMLTANRGAAVDVLVGGGGNDRLISDGGPDVLIGGQGNDVLAVPDAAFNSTRRVLGGSGFDTLRVDGAGVTLNLTTIHDNQIMDIEAIDITGSGSNTLTLNAREVLNLSSHSNNLTVRRNLDDTVNIGVGWTLGSVLVSGQHSFQVFTQGAAKVLIQIPLVVNGTNESDAFVVEYSGTSASGTVRVMRSTNGGAAVSLGTFPMSSPLAINGLGGSDSLRVVGSTGNDTITVNSGTGLIINGTGLALNSIEARTVAGAAGNDIYSFDADAALGTFTLDESGGGTDTIDFSLTTTVGVTLTLANSATQVVHATNLRLNLGSATSFENAIGGSRDDTLIGNALGNRLTGGNGNNILVGLDGSDILTAGTGRDILVGGLGLDILNGGGGDDILIAGRTTIDNSITSMTAIRTEWVSTNSYATRIRNLRSGAGSPLVALKVRINVLNDAGEDDSLTGGAGTDWYFRAVDDAITDLLSGEILDLL